LSRIDDVFLRLRQEGRAALMPFVTAGDPSLDMTGRCLVEMAENGADLIELGMPFSDPLADGPTIQRASQRALAGGITVKGILGFLREFRRNVAVPVVLMGYYNPIYRHGVARFAEEAREAGADGLIVPDLPPEEADGLIEAARAVDLDTVFLLAPTSTPERVRRVSKVSRGFIYYVSLAGVTGARGQLPAGVAAAVQGVRQITNQPVCVGFGISSPEQVRAVSRFADGVIVGSALVGLMEERLGDPECPRQVGAFIRNLRAAIIHKN
jgi:tryptophan synthase alpha chain